METGSPSGVLVAYRAAIPDAQVSTDDEAFAIAPSVRGGSHVECNVVTGSFRGNRRRLYCCSIVDHSGPICVQAFCAQVSTDEASLRRQVTARFGSAAADVEIRLGFDPSNPLACALLSGATAAMPELVSSNPEGPPATG